MKSIISWTCGGFFRSLGRILCYLVIGALIGLILVSNDKSLPSWLKFMHVSASTNVSVSDKSFYVRWEDETSGEKEWSSRSNMGTSISYPSSHPYINALSARYISNSAYFTKGIKYRVVVDVRYGNGNNKNVLYPVSSLLCSGSTSTSWSTNEELIDSCQYISREYLSESNKMRYQFDIVTNTDVRGIKVNFYFDMNKVGLWNIGNVNILTSSFVSYDTSTQQAIESQTTTIINNNNENTQNIIDSISDVSESLFDTDTSEDSSTASDFFHNFNLSIEGPISQIVLLPINMLEYLVVDYNSNNSHSDLCTTFVGKQICLPSGDILWKRSGCHDNAPFGCPNFANFRTFFQLVVGGFIYYKLCRRLVKSAEKGLDPSESGVNMLKL